jgi:hypothetical protein
VCGVPCKGGGVQFGCTVCAVIALDPIGVVANILNAGSINKCNDITPIRQVAVIVVVGKGVIFDVHKMSKDYCDN